MLEDLVSADRYRLLAMKLVCQSTLRLGADVCLQVGVVATGEREAAQSLFGMDGWLDGWMDGWDAATLVRIL